MTPISYFAAWTDSGCLLGCWHEHKTVSEAASCISSAGGYVIAIESGALRALSADEESEFQRTLDTTRTNQPMPQHAEPTGAATTTPTAGRSERGHGQTLVEFVLNWLNKWEVGELKRLHAKQTPALIKRRRKKIQHTVKHEVGPE